MQGLIWSPDLAGFREYPRHVHHGEFDSPAHLEMMPGLPRRRECQRARSSWKVFEWPYLRPIVILTSPVLIP